jgi:hypothetical protein
LSTAARSYVFLSVLLSGSLCASSVYAENIHLSLAEGVSITIPDWLGYEALLADKSVVDPKDEGNLKAYKDLDPSFIPVLLARYSDSGESLSLDVAFIRKQVNVGEMRARIATHLEEVAKDDERKKNDPHSTRFDRRISIEGREQGGGPLIDDKVITYKRDDTSGKNPIFERFIRIYRSDGYLSLHLQFPENMHAAWDKDIDAIIESIAVKP